MSDWLFPSRKFQKGFANRTVSLDLFPIPRQAYMNRYITYLIMGAPGSGKGTQGKILGNVPRFFHCACGDVFRSLDTRTALGKKFIEYSSKGLLVPDDLTVQLWHNSIDAQVVGGHFKPDIDALVLDGIPRTANQASLMKDIIDVRKVLHLSCPNRAELVRRLRKRALKDNRFDDASETVIQDRLRAYEEETKPVLSYFEGIVSTIDATQPPVKVLSDMLVAIWATRDGSLQFNA
jgi:adenylate kinase